VHAGRRIKGIIQVKIAQIVWDRRRTGKYYVLLVREKSPLCLLPQCCDGQSLGVRLPAVLRRRAAARAISTAGQWARINRIHKFKAKMVQLWKAMEEKLESGAISRGDPIYSMALRLYR
jgi:hypothetical protein